MTFYAQKTLFPQFLASYALVMWLENLLISPDCPLTTSNRSETMPIGIFRPKNLSDPNLGLLGPPHVAAEPPDLPRLHPDRQGEVVGQNGPHHRILRPRKPLSKVVSSNLETTFFRPPWVLALNATAQWFSGRKSENFFSQRRSRYLYHRSLKVSSQSV